MANYEVINKPNEIKEYQKVFEKILQEKEIFKKFEKINITYSGGQKQCYIYWSDKYKFWSTSFEFIGEGERKGHRYCNWFGITENEPKKEEVQELVVEINFSLCGGNTSGKLIKNEEKIFVTHNGDIGRISKKDIFWGNYEGKRFESDDLAFIGELTEKEHSKLYKDVMSFIKEVKRIKKITKGNGDNDKQQNVQQKNISNSKKKILLKKRKF